MFRQVVGKCLIVFGATIGVMPLLVFFSVPIYSIGLLLVWKSPLEKSKKLRWTVIPLVLVVVALIILSVVSKLLGTS